MTNDDIKTIITEVLINPLDKLLIQVGKGLAEAQKSLDDNSIATQILIDNDKKLSEWGIRATWYHFPEVYLELKMALTMSRKVNVQIDPVTNKIKKITQLKPIKLLSAPLNASYKNQFNYDVSGASTIKAKIVSIPPPIEETSGTAE